MSSIALYLIPLRQGLSMNLKLADLTKLNGQQAPEIQTLPVPALGLLMYTDTPGVHVGSEKVNSDPHACTKNILPVIDLHNQCGCLSLLSHPSLSMLRKINHLEKVAKVTKLYCDPCQLAKPLGCVKSNTVAILYLPLPFFPLDEPRTV